MTFIWGIVKISLLLVGAHSLVNHTLARLIELASEQDYMSEDDRFFKVYEGYRDVL